MALFKLTDLKRGHLFLEDVNLEAQILAVKSLLARNRKADAELVDEINRLEQQAQDDESEYSWAAEDMWVERLEYSVYHDAANSMASVGMLAPMFESLMTSIFIKMGSLKTQDIVRSERAVRSDSDYWNPHFVYGKESRREDLIGGIQQLAKDTGLEALLPKDYGSVLTALFNYRNMMFHNGFEWPLEKRTSFGRLIDSQNFPDNWFITAEKGNDVWIYYISPLFVDRCLTLIDEVLTAVGALDVEAGRLAGAR